MREVLHMENAHCDGSCDVVHNHAPHVFAINHGTLIQAREQVVSGTQGIHHEGDDLSYAWFCIHPAVRRQVVVAQVPRFPRSSVDPHPGCELCECSWNNVWKSQIQLVSMILDRPSQSQNI